MSVEFVMFSRIGCTEKQSKTRKLKTCAKNTPDGERFRGDMKQKFIYSVILTFLALWYLTPVEFGAVLKVGAAPAKLISLVSSGLGDIIHLIGKFLSTVGIIHP